MTIREFFAAIHNAIQAIWGNFLDLDIVWTLKVIGLFAIPVCFVLWLVGRWLEQDEQRAAQERARKYARGDFND